jgi:hypothetical protein
MIPGILLLLSGCATVSDYGCATEEHQARDLDLTTHYHATTPRESDPSVGLPPKGTVIEVTSYTVGFNAVRIEPCSILSITKNVTLRRGPETDIGIKETREFYAEDGVLITSVTEDVTAQFPATGGYKAVTPLPIPRSAPPGKYRILTRLTMERKSEKRSVVLAAAEAGFQIVQRRGGR